jgi:hypothetical protein
MKAVQLTIALGILLSTPLARAEEPKVRVDVQSDRENTTLLRMTRAGGFVGATSYGSVVGVAEWYKPVCVAPCEAEADANGIYRIGGRGVTPSDTFALPQGSDKIGLRVRAGSKTARGVGWLSVGLGATAAAAGGMLLVFGSVLEPNASDAIYAHDAGRLTRDEDRASTFRTVGFVSLGAGAALVALGIVLVATSGTDVATDHGQTLARAPLGGLTF